VGDEFVNGAGGLDFGVMKQYTMYKVYLIGDDSKRLPTSAMLSESVRNNPVMPAGYNMYRLIDHVTTLEDISIKEFSHFGAGRNKTVFYTDVVLFGENLLSPIDNPLRYANFSLVDGAGDDEDIIVLPVTATRAIMKGVFSPGEKIEFLPYEETVLNLAGVKDNSVQFENGGAGDSTFCWRLPLGLLIDPIPSLPPQPAIRYRGAITQLYVSGYVEQL
jgi:hypothetical protein